jgi:glycosyltransferase involved in cell wall biosynthesis
MATKICFVGLDNYPILNSEYAKERFGGESVQQVLIAKALVDLGYEISTVVHNYGQKDGEVIDKIKVWTSYQPSGGIPIFRFIHPRITSVWKALKRANADVYYQSCATVLTGIVSAYCQLHHKKFIFRTAHDADCIPGKQLIKFVRDRKIYEYGLKRADIIAVQSEKQKQSLKKNYQLNSVLINMAVELPKQENYTEKDIDILWVNNMRPFKRPELALKIAEMLPHRSLTMIGGLSHGFDAFYRRMEENSRKAHNLDFMGQVPYQNINQYFARSKLFLNTSEWEGFPNSFLQAWIRGLPVVSFFDPDNIIDNLKLGSVPSDLENMAECIENLLNEKLERNPIMDRAKTFAQKNYSPKVIAKQYAELLNDT